MTRLRRRRFWPRIAFGTFGCVLLAGPSAVASYRGSDLLTNVGPASQAGGGLVDRYPLSAYALDYHVDVGVTNPRGGRGAPPRRRAADDRPVGRGAAVERDQLPGQLRDRPVHLGVLARPPR